MKFCLLLITVFALLAPAGYSQAVIRKGDVFDLRLSGMPAETASEFIAIGELNQ